MGLGHHASLVVAVAGHSRSLLGSLRVPTSFAALGALQMGGQSRNVLLQLPLTALHSETRCKRWGIDLYVTRCLADPLNPAPSGSTMQDALPAKASCCCLGRRGEPRELARGIRLDIRTPLLTISKAMRCTRRGARKGCCWLDPHSARVMD
jgi:hypothetical protein